MPKRSPHDDEFDFDDDDFEDQKRGPRRFRKEDYTPERKKKWEREEAFDRDHDYDERR